MTDLYVHSLVPSCSGAQLIKHREKFSLDKIMKVSVTFMHSHETLGSVGGAVIRLRIAGIAQSV
jgi:hypothetical protein